MWVSKEDALIVNSEEVNAMCDAYTKRFGEFFPYFNYADFRATEEKSAGQIYKEELEKALDSGEPYHITSHRYDFFEH